MSSQDEGEEIKRITSGEQTWSRTRSAQCWPLQETQEQLHQVLQFTFLYRVHLFIRQDTQWDVTDNRKHFKDHLFIYSFSINQILLQQKHCYFIRNQLFAVFNINIFTMHECVGVQPCSHHIPASVLTCNHLEKNPVWFLIQPDRVL